MNTYNRFHTVYQKLSIYVFYIYFFIIFFGTSLPFRPYVQEIDEKATSNIVNQIVFSTLFLLSIIPFFIRRHDAIQFIKSEKWLTFLLLWCFLTLLWSQYPLVSFKRIFQIVTTVIICLNALIWKKSSKELLKGIVVIAYLYITLSIFSISFVPGAIDPHSLTWRALASSKNHLGQAALVGVLLCFISLSNGGWKKRLLDIVMLILSLTLLIGSRSMTSIFVLIFLAEIWLLLQLDERFQTLGIGHSFFLFAILCISLFALFLSQFPLEIANLLHIAGRDLTFTGRTDLWITIFHHVQNHFLFGAGFGGFWVAYNPEVLNIYKDFVWLPNQAHMGYLDILNETGVIGFFLFLMIVVSYFKNILQSDASNYWTWFFLAALAINLQETTLFRQNVLTGVMFIFSYLALRYDIWSSHANLSSPKEKW